MARWEHFWLTMGFVGFFFVHVTQVVLAGWNNFRSMVSGLEMKATGDASLEAERENWR
jgi:thiosulfate reductase cytochrome b subunit